MTIHKDSQSVPVIADSVRQRLDAVLPLKDSVVLSLTQAAEALDGARKRELMRLSDRVAFAENADSVVRDVRLLELFLPLAMADTDLSQNDPRTRQCEVERRVFQVLQRQIRQTHAKNERWGILIYPIVVLILSTFIFAAISIWIIPVFEQMFSEFGLSLPSPTLLVISISHLFQSIWFWLLFAVLIMLLAVILGMRVADNMCWLIWGNVDSWFSSGYSTRRSLGDLAWHTALLLEVGQDIETAVEIAGAASRKAVLRRESPNLLHHLVLAKPRRDVPRDPPRDPPQNPPRDPPQNPLGDPQEQTAATWYLGVPCHLLTHALNICQDRIEQSAMLREVARLYWDREQTKSVWILSWVQPIAVLMIGLIVGFVVLALFMPLVELITGLT